MSTPTVETWIGSNAIELKNALLARQWNFTGSWQRLRVGMLYGFSSGSYGSPNPTGVRCALGICHGTSSVYGDSPCDYFIGAQFYDLTYVSSSTYTVRTFTSNVGATVVQSPTQTLSNGDHISSWSHFIADDNTEKGKTCWFVDITKGDPNWSIFWYYQGLVNSATYGKTTVESFLSELASTAPSPNAMNISHTFATTDSYPIDENTSGSFNAINVMYNKDAPNPSLLIYAIGVAVLS